MVRMPALRVRFARMMLGVGLAGAPLVPQAIAQAPPPATAPGDPTGGGGPEALPILPPEPPRGVDVRSSKPVVAGAAVVIDVDGPSVPDATYKWAQVEGPPVELIDPTSKQLRLTVPSGAQKLAFLLTIGDAGGERAVRVDIPIQQPPAPPDPEALRADAGDDQVGLVGRRITLNGMRSTPEGRIKYRWLQVDGPAIAQPSQQGATYSFVPKAPGIYRFALIVADAEGISEPEEVAVTVGEFPSDLVSGVTEVVSGGAAYTLEQVVQSVGLINDRPTTGRVVEAMEGIADRAPLYSTFGDLSSEMARRLDAVLPADPQARQFWSQSVFGPLSQITATEMVASGINLVLPQSQGQPLTPSQKEHLQKLFRAYAAAIRPRTIPR